MSYSDEDFAGLGVIADLGLAKEAADYGNLPEMTTGNMLVDMGLYAVPFVGNAMAAGDAVRNFADVVSDLKRGKFLSALGNAGSGALNTLWAIPGIGNVGKLATRLGGRLISGAAKGATKGFTKGVSKNLGKSVAQAVNGSFRGRAGQWLVRNGSGVTQFGQALNRSVPHLGFWKTTGGFMAAGGLTSVGDSMYDRRHQEWENGVNRQIDDTLSHINASGSGSYSPWASQRPQSYSGVYGNPYGQGDGTPYRRYA